MAKNTISDDEVTEALPESEPKKQELKQETSKPEQMYTKFELLQCKTLGVPMDALHAVLNDGVMYTKKQAIKIVTNFLERKV